MTDTNRIIKISDILINIFVDMLFKEKVLNVILAFNYAIKKIMRIIEVSGVLTKDHINNIHNKLYKSILEDLTEETMKTKLEVKCLTYM